MHGFGLCCCRLQFMCIMGNLNCLSLKNDTPMQPTCSLKITGLILCLSKTDNLPHDSLQWEIVLLVLPGSWEEKPHPLITASFQPKSSLEFRNGGIRILLAQLQHANELPVLFSLSLIFTVTVYTRNTIFDLVGLGRGIQSLRLLV